MSPEELRPPAPLYLRREQNTTNNREVTTMSKITRRKILKSDKFKIGVLKGLTRSKEGHYLKPYDVAHMILNELNNAGIELKLKSSMDDSYEATVISQAALDDAVDQYNLVVRHRPDLVKEEEPQKYQVVMDQADVSKYKSDRGGEIDIINIRRINEDKVSVLYTLK